MKEEFDIRASEVWMQREYGDSLGHPMPLFRPTGDPNHDENMEKLFPPMTRRVLLACDDARFAEFRSRVRHALDCGDVVSPYSSVTITRKYDSDELAASEWFYLRPTATFEPSGIECGTAYDESQMCPRCGHGRIQTSHLCLDASRIPKKFDIAKTISWDEVVVSERFVKAVQDSGLLGCEFLPIVDRRIRRTVTSWYQLRVINPCWSTVDPTRFALDYFTDDKQNLYSCPQHDYRGLTVVSELFLRRNGPVRHDMTVTRDRFGILGGVLAPTSMIVVNRKAVDVIRNAKLRGFVLEVAHER